MSTISNKRYSTQTMPNIVLGNRLPQDDRQRLTKARELLSMATRETCSKDRSVLLTGDALVKIRQVLKNNL